MLSIVIPGFLLLMLIPVCRDGRFDISDMDINALSGFLIFIASYLIGLIYHKAVEALFNNLGLRNNRKAIKRCAERFRSDYKKDKSEAKDASCNRHEYYKAYYTLMQNNLLHSAIPVMEAQIAMIRNMLPVILFYIIAICCCRCCIFGINPCLGAILLLIADVILIVILNDIQNKVYYLVWEGKTYLDEIEKQGEQ